MPKIYFLLAHLAEAHEDCGNFCAGCVILRVQLAIRAIDNAVSYCPLHCIFSVAADACRVREVIQLTVCGWRTGVAVQHGDELLTGDVGVRVGAVGHTVGLGPIYASLILRRAASCIFASIASQNRHQHTTSGGCVRCKRGIRYTGEQTLCNSIFNRILCPMAFGIRKYCVSLYLNACSGLGK